MSTSSQDSQTFSSQNALLRLAMVANILAWVILTVTVLDLVVIARQIAQSWPLNLPTGLWDQLGFWVTQIISRYTAPVFYVVALFGISQLIYLGLDILFEKEEAAAKAEELPEGTPVTAEAN